MNYGKIRFKNVDFLRFLFAAGIVYLHLCGKILQQAPHGTDIFKIYKYMETQCINANMIVDCFFIIAGFFLMQNFINKKQHWFEFTIRKIIRLWPVLAFFTLIDIIIHIQVLNYYELYPSIINLLFLQSIGLTSQYTNYNWYISALFWVSIFYYYILSNFQKKYVNLTIVLCIYFSLLGLINYHSAQIYKIDTFLYFFNAGLMRALAGLGIGYFIGIIFNKTKTVIEGNFNDIKSFTFFSFIEITTSVFLIQNFFFVNFISANNLIFYISFSVLFFLMLIKKGVLSKLFENEKLAFFGKYSYSIYVMQGIAFIILGNNLWNKPDFIKNIPVCICISLIFSILLGILTHYLVERPSFNYLNNKLAKFMKK